jgi:hypothetical protein
MTAQLLLKKLLHNNTCTPFGLNIVQLPAMTYKDKDTRNKQRRAFYTSARTEKNAARTERNRKRRENRAAANKKMATPDSTRDLSPFPSPCGFISGARHTHQLGGHGHDGSQPAFGWILWKGPRQHRHGHGRSFCHPCCDSIEHVPPSRTTTNFFYQCP